MMKSYSLPRTLYEALEAETNSGALSPLRPHPYLSPTDSAALIHFSFRLLNPIIHQDRRQPGGLSSHLGFPGPAVWTSSGPPHGADPVPGLSPDYLSPDLFSLCKQQMNLAVQGRFPTSQPTNASFPLPCKHLHLLTRLPLSVYFSFYQISLVIASSAYKTPYLRSVHKSQ